MNNPAATGPLGDTTSQEGLPMTAETFEMILQVFVLLARLIAAGQWA